MKKAKEKNEIANINNQISRLARKFRNCCGLNQSLCSSCFQIHHKVQDLKERKEELREKYKKGKKGI